MLTIYRGRGPDCPKSDDLQWKHCRCPIWIRRTAPDHRLDGEFPGEQQQTVITVERAVPEYLLDAKERNLSEATMEKLKTIFSKGRLVKRDQKPRSL